MLLENEYNQLKPFRNRIMTFNASQPALIIIDKIRQRLGYGSICFDCSGSIATATRDIVELIKEYEKQN